MKRIFLALAFLLLASRAQAAVTANSVITAQTPNLGLVQFLQGTDSAGTYKTLYTGGTNGSLIRGLIATSNDASTSHLVTCQLKRSGVSFGGTAVTVAISSGFATGIAQTNLMSTTNWAGLPLDFDGNPYFMLAGPGDSIVCTFATNLTASDVINIMAVVADY